YGGRVKGAPAGGELTAEHQSRAAFHRLLHLPVEVGAQVEPCLRPDLARRVERITDLASAHFAREPLEEAVGNALHHDEALRGDATLAAVDQTCLGGGPCRPLHVGIVEHDKGIAAAELEHRLLQVPPCLLP